MNRLQTQRLQTLAFASVLASGLCACIYADNNWDGDNPVGNFSYSDNWYGNSQPGWGFGNGSLYFNYRNNGSQTSMYYDYGFWQNTNDIIWETTYAAASPWNANGNGLNFNQRLENRSFYTQTVNISLSGAKNGAGQIELNPVNGDLTLNGALYNDNSKPIKVYGNNGKTLTLNTSITGTGVGFSIEQNSKVVMTSSSNSYTGSTTISAGTLVLGGGMTSGALPTSSTITNNAAIAFNRSDTITQGAHFNSVISGSGALYQQGSGTLVLNGNNTFSGGTTVSAGKLLANNTTGSATGSGSVIVASGATLGGTGTISGSVTAAPGGVLTPGVVGGTPATLRTGSFSLQANSSGAATLRADVNLPIASGGSIDLLDVTGTVTLGDGTNFPTLSFDLVTTGTGAISPGRTFILIRNDASGDAVTGRFAGGTYSGVTNSTAYSLFGGLIQYTVKYAYSGSAQNGSGDGNEVAVTFTAVPEPTTGGLVLAALLGFASHRRPRNHR